jgi:hypothetical protein
MKKIIGPLALLGLVAGPDAARLAQPSISSISSGGTLIFTNGTLPAAAYPPIVLDDLTEEEAWILGTISSGFRQQARATTWTANNRAAHAEAGIDPR